MSDHYKICTRCVMDTTAPDIRFDGEGVCNYCKEYFDLIQRQPHLHSEKKGVFLEALLAKIKSAGKDREYDCILGVSGGLDSSYTVYMAKKLGLKPLAVHLDNGWNSEVSVSNIEKLVSSLGVDLYTHVIDWEEFRDLQIAFFRANVVDIELLTDNAIAAILYKTAIDRRIKYIVAGTNVASEGMRMPPAWNHLKIDLPNLKAIYRNFGSGKKLKTFPMMGLLKYLEYTFIRRIQWVSILDYIDYRKEEAIKILQRETGWRPYEKKHYESVFTRFYQGFILPRKFHVDKRRFHYSTLICSGQMSRGDVLELLKADPYGDDAQLREDMDFVLKKLGFSPEYFENYLETPPVPHDRYPSNEKAYTTLLSLYYRLAGIRKSLFKA